MKKQSNKHLSLIVCMTLVFVMLASLFYIAKEANHDCSGEDCPICACIHQAEQTIRNLGTGVIVSVCIGAVIVLLVSMPDKKQFCLCPVSLVSQKVRLND